MRVVVTGGTGFTGERVVRQLAARGIVPTVVARASSATDAVRAAGAAVVAADLDDPAGLALAFAGHDTLLHVASMGLGQVPGVVSAARSAGIRRAVFVSTTAVLTRLPVRSRPVRLAAEAAVRSSGLDWTILRPTMIYGSYRDRNMSRLLRHLRTWRTVPLPGRGSALQQPVHVEDVAFSIVEAAHRPVACRRDYNVSGARPLSLRALIEHAAGAVGVRPVLVPVAPGAVSLCLRASESLGLRLPVSSEQVQRLCEDKAFDHSAAASDLGFAPRCFSVGIVEEARELGLAHQA